MRDEKLNFILFGVGFVAERHLKAIKALGHNLIGALDTHDSVGVLDRYFPKCEFFTEPERFDRWLSLFRSKPVDVSKRPHWAAVCSPNWLHDAHCRMAMRAGCDVICEKPLVVMPKNIAPLQDAEDEFDRSIHVVHQLRFHPQMNTLKDSEEAKPHDPANPADVVLTYCAPRGPWYERSWKGDPNRSGGIIMNLGIHFLDALIWIYGPVVSQATYLHTPTRMSGVINLRRAVVRWLLSTEDRDCEGGRPNRSMTVDGRPAFDFSRKFGDLHQAVYEAAIDGDIYSVRPDDAAHALELAHRIRTQPGAIKYDPDEAHPDL